MHRPRGRHPRSPAGTGGAIGRASSRRRPPATGGDGRRSRPRRSSPSPRGTCRCLLESDRPSRAGRQAIPVGARRVVADADERCAGSEVGDEPVEPVAGRCLAQDDEVGLHPHHRLALGRPGRGTAEEPAAPLDVPVQDRHLAIAGRGLAGVPRAGQLVRPTTPSRRARRPSARSEAGGAIVPSTPGPAATATAPTGSSGMYISRAVATERSRSHLADRTDRQQDRPNRRRPCEPAS